MISAIKFAISLYSTTVLDLETVSYFLPLHDIRFDYKTQQTLMWISCHPSSQPNLHLRTHSQASMEIERSVTPSQQFL
jgi:hypothetical protein